MKTLEVSSDENALVEKVYWTISIKRTGSQ
jgi:hypothetical protein